MAKPLVTADLVAQAAESLLAQGAEPTIITIQQAIGGGSYTTVKRLLDAWKAQRVAVVPVEAPAAIEQQARLLAREVWATALNHAEQQTNQVREDAARQIGELGAALTTAEAIISQQEGAIEKLNQALEEARVRVDEAQQTTQAATARAAELERLSSTAQAQVESTQALLLAQARELGELDALRRQVAEQNQMLERLARQSDKQ